MNAIIKFSHKNTNHRKEQLFFLVHSLSERKTRPLISQVCSLRPPRFYLRENPLPTEKEKREI